MFQAIWRSLQVVWYFFLEVMSRTFIKSPPVDLPDFPNKDRILGAIYGNCIGDAIGLLTEFMNKSEAKQNYEAHKGGLLLEHKIPDMHRARWENGDWTDDSDQMILIMDSIVECNGRVDYKDYGRRLKEWARHGFPELGDYAGMGLGATTHHVLKHQKYGDDPHKAAEHIWEHSGRNAAPNGAAMRTSVLGVYNYMDIHKVMAQTLDICKVTHFDHRCQASVIAITTAIALMLRGQHVTKSGEINVDAVIEESYDLARTAFTGLSDKQAKEKELRRYMTMKLAELKLDDTQTIGYTFKAMGAGFWALRQKNFYKAMEAVVFEAGDADSNGAVAGAMLGCKLGASQLPPQWLNKLVHKNWLDQKISRFAKLMFPEQFAPSHPAKSSEDKFKELNMSGAQRHHPESSHCGPYDPATAGQPDATSSVRSQDRQEHVPGSSKPVAPSATSAAHFNAGPYNPSDNRPGHLATHPDRSTMKTGAPAGSADLTESVRSNRGSTTSGSSPGVGVGKDFYASDKEERRKLYNTHVLPGVEPSQKL